MENIRKRPEILAPAGSIESLKGAVAAGADAVYIGGSKFGARAYAENPEKDSLLAAIDYVHEKDRRIYLTVNTLVKERELTGELYAFIENYYKAGIDAVIVQDVGVLHFLAEHFPELPVHASTQMTLVSAEGIHWFENYPVTRLVPARELSLQEIKTIRSKTDLEIECFVHGALCYCYSGQCLFSSMIGGRSGNRGRCAQPCRMPYTVLEDGKKLKEGCHILSPKDMCTLDMIPKLVDAGIDSYKIEGRMKRPEYTAGVTAAYRRMTDLYFSYGEAEFYRYMERHPDILKEEMIRVGDLYNRGGFTKGYYVQYHGASMMTMNRPNHSGVKVGEVDKVQGSRAGIRLTESLHPQDVAEIRDRSGEVYEFTVGKSGLEAGNGRYETNVKKGFRLEKGQEVYRTKNENLLQELADNYVNARVQMPVRAQVFFKTGEPVAMKVSLLTHRRSSLHPEKDREDIRLVEVTVTGEEVQTAKNQPITEEKIREQLQKTGESEFYFEQLDIIQKGDGFLPMGKLKELRRRAFEQLREEILSGYRRSEKENPEESSEQGKKTDRVMCRKSAEKEEPEVIALVSVKEQWEAVLATEKVTTVYVDLQNAEIVEQVARTEEVRKRGKRAFLVLPHIFREKERLRYQKEAELLQTGNYDGFLVKSLEELKFLKDNALDKKYEVRLNYNLYAFQSEAKKFFRDAGILRVTVPVELNEEEWKDYDVSGCDLLVYGRIPLMISAQCIRDNILTCRNGEKTEGIALLDRLGAAFPVRQICTSCYNIIYNSACFSLLGTGVLERFLPAGYRMDFTIESKKETEQVLRAFAEGKVVEGVSGPFTKGHLRRGVE